MAYDEDLADRIRELITTTHAVTEQKMFGGIGFMLNGNMLVAASDRGLLARVGEHAQETALEQAGARLMMMKGRAFPGYVQIERDELDARAVKRWVKLARAYVETLPAKKKPAKTTTKAKKVRAR